MQSKVKKGDPSQSVKVILAVGNKKHPNKDKYEFDYDINEAGGKTTYFAVYDSNDGGCSELVDGKIIPNATHQTPHAFIWNRHHGTTSTGKRRKYSIMGMIRMDGITLAEWRKKGDCIFTNRQSHNEADEHAIFDTSMYFNLFSNFLFVLCLLSRRWISQLQIERRYRH